MIILKKKEKKKRNKPKKLLMLLCHIWGSVGAISKKVLSLDKFIERDKPLGIISYKI